MAEKKKEDFKVGDEVIVEGYRFPMVVARIGEKRVMIRIPNFPFLFSIPKEKVIWRSPQPFEQVKKSLKDITGYEAQLVLMKKKRLSEIT